MININFDFQKESSYKDSDRWSPTLQEYHRILWSKPLPRGELFTLSKISQNRLYHNSFIGEFYLSSDRAVATLQKQKTMKQILSQIDQEELIKFKKLSDTIGGIVIWPSKRVNNKMTINGARGFNRFISYRLDLTLECIRRYYIGVPSPLSDVLERYSAFFELFVDFRGYINFFLLQDAVSNDYSIVNIAPPFNDFHDTPLPKNDEEYIEYILHTSRFINKRNSRIDTWQKSL